MRLLCSLNGQWRNQHLFFRSSLLACLELCFLLVPCVVGWTYPSKHHYQAEVAQIQVAFLCDWRIPGWTWKEEHLELILKHPFPFSTFGFAFSFLLYRLYNFQRVGCGKIIESGEHAGRGSSEICCYRWLHGQRAAIFIGCLDTSQWNQHMKLVCVNSWGMCGVYRGLTKSRRKAPALVQMLLEVACSLSFTRQSDNHRQLLSNVSG